VDTTSSDWNAFWFWSNYVRLQQIISLWNWRLLMVQKLPIGFFIIGNAIVRYVQPSLNF